MRNGDIELAKALVERFAEADERLARLARRELGEDAVRSSSAAQLGTLGGGNHFISLERSEKTGEVFLIVRIGSRRFGKAVGLLCSRCFDPDAPQTRSVSASPWSATAQLPMSKAVKRLNVHMTTVISAVARI